MQSREITNNEPSNELAGGVHGTTEATYLLYNKDDKTEGSKHLSIINGE
jgi:hypothetical protein